MLETGRHSDGPSEPGRQHELAGFCSRPWNDPGLYGVGCGRFHGVEIRTALYTSFVNIAKIGRKCGWVAIGIRMRSLMLCPADSHLKVPPKATGVVDVAVASSAVWPR